MKEKVETLLRITSSAALLLCFSAACLSLHLSDAQCLILHTHTHPHTLTATYTCCYDAHKTKISHAHSLILSTSLLCHSPCLGLALDLYISESPCLSVSLFACASSCCSSHLLLSSSAPHHAAATIDSFCVSFRYHGNRREFRNNADGFLRTCPGRHCWHVSRVLR